MEQGSATQAGRADGGAGDERRPEDRSRAGSRRETRAAWRHFDTITTRWLDNDAYGHVNNVVYYAWFDTAVNRFLIERGALDVQAGEVIGLVVETRCEYFASAAFPDTIHAGVRVARLGTSSVRYEIGLFRNDEPEAIAQGHFVHVYVDRASRRPVPLPPALRDTLAPLLATAEPPADPTERSAP